jgi:hypothetical protein
MISYEDKRTAFRYFTPLFESYAGTGNVPTMGKEKIKPDHSFFVGLNSKHIESYYLYRVK